MPEIKGKLSVETENILPIIKKWLYSQKEIFLRELISNSFDAVKKLKKIATLEDIRDSKDVDYAIDIRLDREKKVLTIEDNGVGMTSDELSKYIANIAFSGAQDFVKKYEQNGDKDKAGIIGNFGLGFYSSFMVADSVCVDSLNYQKDATPAYWHSSGGVDYEIGEGQRNKRGTTISLSLNQDSEEFLDRAKINELVRQFVDFLPIPVRVDGTQANRCDPLWTKSPSSLKKEDYHNFYQYLYPHQGLPLFYVHINVDYPFQLQGILFFPRLRHEMDLNRSNVKIYCKQVFVSDKAQELIPQYLTILQGIVDMPDLPLNVSRSYLQNEPQIKKIASHIVKKVADRLKEEFQKNRKEYEGMWPDIAPFIKYAMMNDERFYEQAESAMVFQIANTGKEKDPVFLTIDEYCDRYKDKTGKKIYYVSNPKSQVGHLSMLAKQGISAVILDALIDSHFMQFMESKGKDYQFTRVDAEINEHVLDKKADSKLVDVDGKDIKEELSNLFEKSLANDKITLRVEALNDKNIPAMILLPEHARRFQEMSAVMSEGPQAFEIPINHTLVLNSQNQIIRSLSHPAIISGDQGKDEKQVLIAKQIYYLAYLAQGSMNRSNTEQLLQVSYRLLEQVL